MLTLSVLYAFPQAQLYDRGKSHDIISKKNEGQDSWLYYRSEGIQAAQNYKSWELFYCTGTTIIMTERTRVTRQFSGLLNII